MTKRNPRSRLRLVRSVLIAAAFLAIPGRDGVAQQTSEPSTEILFARSVTGGTVSAYLTRSRYEFRSIDMDGDGVITAFDLELHEKKLRAAARGNAILALLALDLDGDGTLSRDEIEASFSALAQPLPSDSADGAERRKRIAAPVNQKMRLDTNGDGRIDGDEMMAYAKQLPAPRMPEGNSLPWAALSLDKDGDHRITLDEYLEGAVSGFSLVDTNGDGVASDEEVYAFRRGAGASAVRAK